MSRNDDNKNKTDDGNAGGGGGDAPLSRVDDGHIRVCVRIRNVPPPMSGRRSSTGSTTRKSTLREETQVCVSALENIVVLHDPNNLGDASTVARDANNVVQLLTDRVSTKKSRKLSRLLITTGTANFYEFDDCISSMSDASRMKMPIIKSSDFLQPPPYGTQEDVYAATAVHAVQAAVEGINSCVFAYGQTGSGKTYTLFGDSANLSSDPGIVPRALDDLFTQLDATKLAYLGDTETEYTYHVQLSFFEIYQNEVFCLFSKRGPLHVQFSRDMRGKKETMVINDLQQHVVTSAAKAYQLIEVGLRRRQTGETGMNARSSRSHAILQVRVGQYRTKRDTRETMELNATINLVDLAGSERQRTANTLGKSRDEGIQINQSLATLARVINDISQGAKYVNYRDSLLTMVLKDNLGGNSKTFMIANISPVSFSFQESCATLTYAKAVRCIRNRPVVNRAFQTRATLLEQNARLKDENEKLKEQIEEWMKRWRDTEEDKQTTDYHDNDIFPSPGENAHEAVVSAVTAAGMTAPLMVSSHRTYTHIAGIGSATVSGGVVRVTSLVHDSMEFPLHEMVNGSYRNAKGSSGSGDIGGGGGDGGLADSITTDADALFGLGALKLERVSQRSCEQRFYLHFIPPANQQEALTLTDLQVNGKSFGANARRELYHGDVVCAYIDGGGSSGNEHILLSFHYVNLNCLSRNAGSADRATIGQLAVSMDLPADDAEEEEGESNTASVIDQLKRDNAKLLDMLRQQAQNLEFERQRGPSLSLVTPMLSSASPNAESPRLFLTSPEGYHASATVPEAFRRISISPSIRPTLTPADTEEDEIMRRAEKQGISVDRLADALDENRKLHRTVAGRNATLEALAKRLAELEGDGSSLSATSAISDDDNDSHSEAEEAAAAEGVDRGVSASPLSDTIVSLSRETSRAAIATTTTTAAAVPDPAVPSKSGRRSESARPTMASLEEEADIGDGKTRIYIENSEGVRERYHSAVREAGFSGRIAALEALIADLRAQLGLMESRLRVAKDDTLEQEMMHDQLAAERDALMEELALLRGENAELTRDNTALEVCLQQNEEALAAATAMNEEELAKKVKGLTDQINALTDIARLWKRRTMKYIAKGYDEDAGELHLDEIPWEDVQYGVTAELIKKELGGDACSQDTINAVDAFEQATAIESVIALEAALQDLEARNQRLQDDIARYKKSLEDCMELINRLKREKAELERALRSAAATADEKQKLQAKLNDTTEQLADAEKTLRETQKNLDSATQQSKEISRKANKQQSRLASAQRQATSGLESRIDQLENELMTKDAELRHLLQYMDDEELIEGPARDIKLRAQIEDLISDGMKECRSKPTAYSTFPTDFKFSDELIALIRISLRVLLDRLKVELYVLNKQNLHKLGLLVPTVQLRPEAQFHRFIHEVRGVVGEMTGRAQRIGGKWSLTDSDVLASLVDHRRRRVGGALYGLLVWYDHWDLSPKAEHVSYMELIRNGDHVLQMARLARQESLLNTNAASTLMLPLPSKKKGASETTFLSDSAKKTDTSISESRRILGKMQDSCRRSNLAQALNEASISRRRGDGGDVEENPFSRTATALALSQSLPLSRQPSTNAQQQQQQQQPERERGRDRDRGSASNESSHQTLRRSAASLPPRGAAASVSAFKPLSMSINNSRPASSAAVMSVSEEDVAFVAGTDVADAESINRYKYERRMSIPTTLGSTSSLGGESLTRAASTSKHLSRTQTLYGLGATVSEVVNEMKRMIKPNQSTSSSSSKEPPSNSNEYESTLHKVGSVPAGASSSQLRSVPVSVMHKAATPATSFYNPDIMKALRERSISEANTSAAAKSRDADGHEAVPKRGAEAPRRDTKRAADPAPFEATRTLERDALDSPRRSTTYREESSQQSLEIASSASTLSPLVPLLDLSTLSGKKKKHI